jgi:hypothetical protein
MQGVYIVNIRFNQKFMFCNDRGIRFSFWLYREYASSTFGIPTLLLDTMGIPTLPRAG